ncbi:hypothetical protein BMMON2_34010 [Burkholderia mallei]
MHAVAARVVVAGRDHAALVGTAADRERTAAQRRIVAHLDRRVETVAVAMDDLAREVRRVARGRRRRVGGGIGLSKVQILYKNTVRVSTAQCAAVRGD